MSVCLVTIAGKEEYADIRQVSACSGCPYSIAGVDKRVDRCDYYSTPFTQGDFEYALKHEGKPAWCTLDYVIVVHKPKGE